MNQVVVIGAGAIGLCSAYALRKRGFDVVVLDRAEPGSGASHGNGGWICPGYSDPVPAPSVRSRSLRWLTRPDSPLYIRPRPDPAFLSWLWSFWRKCNERDYQHALAALERLNRRTLDLYDAMTADGVSFEMHEQGLLFLFLTHAAESETAHELGRMERFGYAPARHFDRREIRQELPPVADEVVAGILAPGERHVRPESLIAGLSARLKEMDVEVRASEPVRSLAASNGRITGVETPRERVPANHVVLAAGIWSSRLAGAIGVRLPLQAGKGYSITVDAPSEQVRRPLEFAEAHVGFSPYDGAMRVLGTMELSGMNTNLSPVRLAALRKAVARYLPGLELGPVREEWTGMRPLTSDGLPVIGAVPGHENVVIATGHAMLGITLAPATGEAVADIVAGQPDRELLAPFRVDRL